MEKRYRMNSIGKPGKTKKQRACYRFLRFAARIGGVTVLQIWGQANNYARLIIVLYFIIPTALIFLTCVAEGGGQKDV